MSFDNFKVSTRLALGFGITILLGLLIAIISAMQLGVLVKNLDDIANNRIVKIDQFRQVGDNFNLIARLSRNILLKPDADFRESELKRIQEARAKNAKLLDSLNKTVTTGKGPEYLKTITDTRFLYIQSVDEVIALAKQDKVAEATELLLGTTLKQQQILFKAIEDISDYEIEMGRELANQAGKTASLYEWLTAALAFAMAVIAGTLGWTIARSLTRALGAEPAQVNAAMQRVAEGDLNVAIVLRDNDRTSIMATVKGMQESLSGTV
ncbi:MAG: MCP four helix bundle domain-containing protein, partial [Ferruginibacter sp.]|nr:MCP four helix bundle domain-containing protein [Rhodoferax sp.]